MTEILDNLIALLSLEPIEENLFRGRSEDLGLRQLFGGQVLGQAVSAASQTVEPGRQVHSLHGYFLRPGDASLPVLYEVDPLRDGKSFSARRVTAIQKGRPIFTCAASFQAGEQGLEHQRPTIPEVPGPEGLLSETELARQVADRLPARIHDWAISTKPIEIRPVTQVNSFSPEPCEPIRYAWFRADGRLPDDPHLHRYLLAYASDFSLLNTVLQPHGVSVFQRFMQVASLDHALWFHGDLRLDDWLLFAVESPWAANARGFARGHVFDRDGRLVASMAQEGLIRLREDLQ
ncbi:acyl-CoA thioesterase II [Azorhizophilus paspali]|uniref:Acyl-CoA thioesterase II n=1 Tax=Azorhizophilus paspali TaxID=69963 RepID=A0ABV6SU77_AZOPA